MRFFSHLVNIWSVRSPSQQGAGNVKIDRNPVVTAGPVAQSVERWTPCGESTRPGQKGPGFEALDVYVWASWRVWLRFVLDHSQMKSVRGPAVRGYVRTLNIWL